MQHRKHFCWIDWLRFLAAFFVLVSHARGSNWCSYGELLEGQKNILAWLFFAVSRLGLEAVVIFFVLSGFLVGGKVLERVMDGTFDIKAYALDRVTRVYVPLLPVFLLTGLISLRYSYQITFGEFFGNLLGLQEVFCNDFVGNPVLWSLGYEIWFYLLAGFFALMFRKLQKAKVIGILGGMLSLALFTKLDATFLFCWVIGALGYRLLKVKLNWFGFSFGLLLTLLGMGLSQFLSDSVSVQTEKYFFLPSKDVAMLMMSLGLAFLVPFLSQKIPQSKKWIFFENMGTRLAAFSYTLYLIHYPLLGLWTLLPGYERSYTLSLESFLWFFSKILVSLILSWLFYLPFEKQTGRIRNWIKNKMLYSYFKNYS